MPLKIAIILPLNSPFNNSNRLIKTPSLFCCKVNLKIQLKLSHLLLPKDFLAFFNLLPLLQAFNNKPCNRIKAKLINSKLAPLWLLTTVTPDTFNNQIMLTLHLLNNNFISSLIHPFNSRQISLSYHPSLSFNKIAFKTLIINQPLTLMKNPRFQKIITSMITIPTLMKEAK